MKKIKILRIISRLNIGGPAINAILLTEGLNYEKFESILVTGSADKTEGDMFYLAKKAGIKSIIIPELCRVLNIYKDFIAFWRLFLLIKKEKPDIIHTHTAKAGTLGRLAGILYNLITYCWLGGIDKRKCIMIHTFHGHVLRGYFNKFLTYLFMIIEKILSKFTDKIIVVSERIKKDILSFGIADTEKIKVIHLGFELDKLLDIPFQKQDNSLNIGIVGRLVPIKNHKMFFDAIKLLSEYRIPNTEYRFFIVGDGALREELENYARELGITDRVKFLGWQRDLVSIYQNLDIVALTSLNEGTPVSLIEALASARPVIATDVGGVRDIIGSRLYPEVSDRGILVKSNDLDSFVNGLKMLISDATLFKKLSISGREFVKKNFTSERLIKDIEILYNRVLSR